MSPQEHYDEAEQIVEERADTPEEWNSNLALAQVHATLALAGFTRDAPSDYPAYPFVPSKGARA
jgi:hypothetical protein